ncbi:hypothetical protein CC1G_07923 [Coprinopsis cinerea okayama7|uniref:Uncharacterized protein n=1 Tax=Coprinopsis cinerea (strain Okayama-7 / 130 / ATCC MYA-4618 / FGSC 9003) TaxID=240176 RepID=A8P6R2_COPC7|nr:hypothetical protein CC1G_07923 [Coprinopsis cinerea okayama7\|eukprot:XP_001839208.2 hypothetical protein CC1G_07923 [Coprinopsis cinerea okayama7\
MTSQPAITDADDSIVLSDLVRTGEASRLRRRGALRLDRNSIHHNPPVLPRNFGRPPLFLEDSDSDEENRPYSFAYGQSDMLDRHHRAFTSHQHQYPSYSRWVEELDVDDENPTYILVCGAEVDVDSTYPSSSTPFKPSLLPVTPPKPGSSSRNGGSKKSNNGCGAYVHFAATCAPSAQHATRTYTARSPATDVVVPLASEYFHPYVGVRFETSACGCVKEGIGCVVCGNPLGTRWRFCERMAEGRRKGLARRWRQRQQQRGLVGPDGPPYWGGAPSTSSSSSRTRSSYQQQSSDLNAQPCPITDPSSSSSSASASSSSSSPSSTTQFYQPPPEPPLELYTFFSNAVTAFVDPTAQLYPKPRVETEMNLPVVPTEPNSPVVVPTEPNSPLSSPTFAPSSPRTRRPWRASVSSGSSDDDDHDQRVNFDEVLGLGITRGLRGGREVNIEDGSASSTIGSSTANTSASAGAREVVTRTDFDREWQQRLSHVMIAPPLFDRQFTSSPEPFLPLPRRPLEDVDLNAGQEDGNLDADRNVVMGTLRVGGARRPAGSVDDRATGTADDDRPTLAMDVGRTATTDDRPTLTTDDRPTGPTTDRPTQTTNDRPTGPTDEPLPTGTTTTRSIEMTHPQPQPMSFYQQQVLGAWERERQRLRRQQQQHGWWGFGLGGGWNGGGSGIGGSRDTWRANHPREVGGSTSTDNATENGNYNDADAISNLDAVSTTSTHGTATTSATATTTAPETIQLSRTVVVLPSPLPLPLSQSQQSQSQSPYQSQRQSQSQPQSHAQSHTQPLRRQQPITAPWRVGTGSSEAGWLGFDLGGSPSSSSYDGQEEQVLLGWGLRSPTPPPPPPALTTQTVAGGVAGSGGVAVAGLFFDR